MSSSHLIGPSDLRWRTKTVWYGVTLKAMKKGFQNYESWTPPTRCTFGKVTNNMSCLENVQHCPQTSYCLNRNTFLSKHLSLSNRRNAFQHITFHTGGDASEESYSMALKLAHKILGVYTSATHIVSVSMGNEPKEFMDNVLQDGTFRNEENNSEYFEDLFTDFVPVEDLGDTEFYTESEPSSPYKSLESVGLKSSLSSHLNAFSSDDSRDQKSRRSMSLSAGSRSRSNSEGSIDMFYDYSNSSDDGKKFVRCWDRNLASFFDE